METKGLNSKPKSHAEEITLTTVPDYGAGLPDRIPASPETIQQFGHTVESGPETWFDAGHHKSPFMSPGSRALTKLLAWVVAILVALLFWVLFITGAFARADRTGAKTLPGLVGVGQTVSAHPGGWNLTTKYFRHISDSESVSGDKLSLEACILRAPGERWAYVMQNNLWGNYIIDINTYRIIYYLTLCFNPITMESTEKIAQLLPLLDGEIWRPIPDTNDLYHVSTHGRVFSFRSKYKYKARPMGLLKPHVHSLGYLCQTIWRGTEGYRPYKIHRLVGLTFIENPGNKPEINHIDHNKANNHVSNLEWVTHKENIVKSFEFGHRKIARGTDHWNTGKHHSASTKRKMARAKLGEKHPKFNGWYVIDGIKYASATQAAKALGIHAQQVIRRAKNESFPTWQFIPC